MSHHLHAWNVECIRERFTIVKTEITDLNGRHTRLLVFIVLVATVFLGAATFYLFETKNGPVFLGILAMILFTSIALIYLIVNSSEKCVSKLSFCLLTLDDKDVFFKAISEVSCGGDAITYFLQFADKATKIVEIVNPGNSANTTPPGGN